MKKILVLGGSGLVGKNLENYVTNIDGEWIFCSSKDADLTIYKEVEQLFNKHKPTHVINLAAYVGGLYRNMREPVTFFEQNMLININVMKASVNVKKLISILSTCIFPDDIEYPITEDKLHNGPPHDSNEGYSYAKRMIDVLSRSYNKQYGTNYVSIIPGNLYGKYDSFDLDNAHVIPALIHKCYLAKKENKDFVVSGTGCPLRQFTYAEDLAKYLVWVLDNYDENSPMIISNEIEHSIWDVVSIISKEMDFGGRIVFDSTQSDGQHKKTISCDKLSNMNTKLGFTGIEQGISATVSWFLEKNK
jgi:GDP-L-fucose synthase